MSNQDKKHDWRPGLVAGASDLPVGVISGAGGAAAADAILKKKLQSAPPEHLARLEKLHGRVSHLGTGLIAGGAALAYADYMQRKHEQELAEAKMSKVANVYLEKIASQMTTEKAVDIMDHTHDRHKISNPKTPLIAGTTAGAVGGLYGALIGHDMGKTRMAIDGAGIGVRKALTRRGAGIGAAVLGVPVAAIAANHVSKVRKAEDHLKSIGLTDKGIDALQSTDEYSGKTPFHRLQKDEILRHIARAQHVNLG